MENIHSKWEEGQRSFKRNREGDGFRGKEERGYQGGWDLVYGMEFPWEQEKNISESGMYLIVWRSKHFFCNFVGV